VILACEEIGGKIAPKAVSISMQGNKSAVIAPLWKRKGRSKDCSKY